MTISNALRTSTAIAVLGSSLGVAAQAPQPPKPGPEHQRLAFFVGKWTSEGELKASPMGPAGKITGADNCEWFDGHFAVVCRSEGKTPMGPMTSLGILGYSTEERVYTYTAVDSSGMSMTTVPKGTVSGNTWTYNDESLMGGQKMKSRVIIKETSPTTYDFTMEMQGPDGKWMPLMESKNTKAK